MRSGSIEVAGAAAATAGGLAIAAGGRGGTLKSLFVKPCQFYAKTGFTNLQLF